MTDYQRNTSDPADESAELNAEAARIGATLAAGAFVSLLVWIFFVNFWLGPSSELVYSDCLSQTAGKVTHINYSTFPTQIYCETADDRYAGAIYPFWSAVGLSSIFVILAGVILYGLWMVVRRDKNEPQTAP